MYRKNEHGRTLSDALGAPQEQYPSGTAYYSDNDGIYAAVNIQDNGSGTVVVDCQSFAVRSIREMARVLHERGIDRNSGWTSYNIY